MNKLQAIGLAMKTARDQGIDEFLFAALVEQESDWNNWAVRLELAFYRKYVQPMNLSDTEEYARSFSWGPCQVMGEVARELGYNGPLAQLCEWETGLYWGAMKLKRELDGHSGDFDKALLAYNGGSNHDYPSQVLARMEKYKQGGV